MKYRKVLKRILGLSLLLVSAHTWAQPCSKESFSNVSDKIVARGYRVMDMKTEAQLPVLGAQNFIFYVEQGYDYVFVLTTREPLMRDEFLGVNISDSSGHIAQKLVNENLLEVHFSPRKSEYVSIDAWLRSNSKNRDHFCMFRLFAVRKLDGGE